jgi:3-hydroxyisobutyrate dehydrogenase-like beta-hydroxyacid dehydrogenase
MAKDVAIAAALAKELGVDAPYLRETLKHWRDAAKAMPRDADHTEIYKYQAKRSKRRKR